MQMKFWGTRGSIPVPGKDTLKYGGNTPCVEIRSGNTLLVLDAGSGIRELGLKLNGEDTKEITLLITHYHWDHIQGLPFFRPMYNKDINITIYGIKSNGHNVKEILSRQQTSDYFPLKIDDFNAKISFKEISTEHCLILNNLEIETFMVNHPSPTLTYKIREGDKSIVYMTDNELNISTGKYLSKEEFLSRNKELIDFCYGCDYLIHDTMYDETAMEDKKGWGHSSNISLAYFSQLANVKNLLFFHYNPDYSDSKIDALLSETKEVLLGNGSKINVIASSEGLELSI